MKTQSLTGLWQFRQLDTLDWLPATVPGGVHTNLLALDRIPDPFVGDNEKRVSWVAESDWEYRRTFTVDPIMLAHDKVDLVCAGLDTLADVCLDDQLIERTANMFRQYRWEVKSLLASLKIEIEQTVRRLRQHTCLALWCGNNEAEQSVVEGCDFA